MRPGDVRTVIVDRLQQRQPQRWIQVYKLSSLLENTLKGVPPALHIELKRLS